MCGGGGDAISQNVMHKYSETLLIKFWKFQENLLLNQEIY
jgi:hypothetical protein